MSKYITTAKEYAAIGNHFLNGERKSKTEYAWHETSHLPKVKQVLNECKLYRDVKNVLDVGASFGSFLFFYYMELSASGYIKKLHGIELFDKNVKIFNEELKNYFPSSNFIDVQLFHCNALDFDKYHQYDFIFTYSPCYQLRHEERERFYNAIVDGAESGTFLYECYERKYYFNNPKLKRYFTHKGHTIYVKNKI